MEIATPAIIAAAAALLSGDEGAPSPARKPPRMHPASTKNDATAVVPPDDQSKRARKAMATPSPIAAVRNAVDAPAITAFRSSNSNRFTKTSLAERARNTTAGMNILC